MATASTGWSCTHSASVVTNGATSATIRVYCYWKNNGWTYNINHVNAWVYCNGVAKQVMSAGSVNAQSSTSASVSLGYADFVINKSTSAQSISCYAKITSNSSYVSGTKSSTAAAVSVSAKTYYTVSYNANGGSGAPGTQTKWYGTDLTLSSTKPTRTGYTFAGWATSASGAVAYAAGAKYKANAAVTLYAKWTANTYTVTFNANGGSGAPAAQTKTYGTDLTLSSTKPTRTNYNFLGWATSASATSATYAAGGKYKTNAAVTLYAVWQLAYVKPRIKGLSVFRCDADGEASDSGTYYKVIFNWETDKEAVSYRISRTPSGGAETGTTYTITGTSGSVDQLCGGGNVDIDKTHSVTITVTDAVDSTKVNVDIPSRKYLIDTAYDTAGENLLANTAFTAAAIANIDPWNSSVTTIVQTTDGLKFTGNGSGKNGIRVPLAYDGCLENNEYYTLSFDYRGTMTDLWGGYILQRTEPNASINMSVTALTPSETEWQHYEGLIWGPNVNTRIGYALILAYSSEAAWLEIKSRTLKLEKGRKATAWRDYDAPRVGVSVGKAVEELGAFDSTALNTKMKIKPQPNSWLTGKEGENAPINVDVTPNTNSYFPIMAGRTYSGHKWSFGTLGDEVGFSFYDVSNTGNSRNWYMYWLANTGSIIHNGGTITSLGGIFAQRNSVLSGTQCQNGYVGFFRTYSNAAANTNRLGWVGFGSTANNHLSLTNSTSDGYVYLGCSKWTMVVRPDSGTYSGYCYPSVTNGVTLGTNSNRWYQLYQYASAISTSDEREKHDIAPFTNLPDELVSEDGSNKLESIFNRLEPKVYRMNKGDQTLCIGFVAQDVAKILDDLDIEEDYLSFLTHDYWTDEETDEEKDLYSLAYTELIGLIVHMIQKQQKTIDAQQKEIDDLKSRIEKLEALLLKEE